MTLQDAISKYGAIVDGKWARESEFCAIITPHPKLKWVNSLTCGPVFHVYCNKDMSVPLLSALENVVLRKLDTQLLSFDGCKMIRDVRGQPGSLSCHAYALAIDINAASNRLGDEPSMSPELVKCFTDEGFAWGGHFHRKDGMHFSRGWEG